MRTPHLAAIQAARPPELRPARMSVVSRCAVCRESHLYGELRRFGGQRVCSDCWQGLSRLERSWAFRTFPRTSLVAMFAAEVAVRQPDCAPIVDCRAG